MAKTLPCKVQWKDLLSLWTQDPKQLYFVAARWQDAALHSEGTTGTIEAITVGVLRDITRKAVSLSHDVMEDLEHRETSTLPRKMVRHLTLFGVIPPFQGEDVT